MLTHTHQLARTLGIGIVSALLASVASAQLTDFSVVRTRQYTQSSAAAPTITRYGGFLTATVQSPTSISGIAVDTPGPRAPFPLFGFSIGSSDIYTGGQTYLAELDLDADFSSGPYVLAFSGTPAISPVTADINFPAYPPAVPQLSSASIAALQSVVPGQSIPIALTNTSGGQLSAIIIDPLTSEGFGLTNLGSSGVAAFNIQTTSPLGMIRANRNYELQITLSASTITSIIGTPARTEIASSSVRVTVPFTSIPAPTSVSLLGLGTLLAARRRR